MNKTVFLVILGTLMIVSTVAGVICAIYDGDKLFAMSFASDILLVVWMLTVTFKKTSHNGGQS